MKIPLSSQYLAGAERIVVEAIILYKNIPIKERLLVDTGSPYTMISEKRLQKSVRLPNLEVCGSIQLGGINVPYKNAGQVNIQLFDKEVADIKSFDIDLYLLCFAPNYLPYISSFIGKDFIDKYNLAISKKDPTGSRYLE